MLASAMLAASIFLSTPSARRATAGSVRGMAVNLKISIHALREEGDALAMLCFLRLLLFLSTPSARRATCFLRMALAHLIFLSTPSARRATPTSRGSNGCGVISIHALREEGDLILLWITC